MPLVKKLTEYLYENKVSYEIVHHPIAYTAQELAASMHVPGRDFAKVVIVKARKGYAMVVLPASCKIALDVFKDVVDDDQVRLATEDEFKGLFPDSEPGAMPPFGNVYGLPVYVDEHLTHEKEIYFQAGNHTQSMKVRYADFARLVQPVVDKFCTHA
ncbi:MAG: YbaK/EbsC family protein [Deltaproteobacteria bacterium]|nr:YbaK/EbsC family protein [Deltaproteobacteria bacterium]MBI3078061.1 YbaK/EbsC family protein [Deltaproteobacteria bacterium]